jgi:hypothetical protein
VNEAPLAKAGQSRGERIRDRIPLARDGAGIVELAIRLQRSLAGIATLARSAYGQHRGAVALVPTPAVAM